MEGGSIGSVLKHGSLFSGIGGFDLAAEWMGWENAFHCEIGEFGRKILKHYWPEAESYEDIKTADFSKWEGKIDVLTGGFPCQPYSSAGKRKGKEDERHLWPEMLRVIRLIRPRWIVGENVRGLVNWNEGMVFDEVHSDLEEAGYHVQAFLIPACGVSAPHRRDRVWFVAHRNVKRCDNGRDCRQERSVPHNFNGYAAKGQSERSRRLGRVGQVGGIRDAPDTDSDKRCEGRMHEAKRKEAKRHFSARNARRHKRTAWQDFPTQSPICFGDDGLPTELDGITFPNWRNESIKAAGNAVVPQVVYQIFKAIEAYERI